MDHFFRNNFILFANKDYFQQCAKVGGSSHCSALCDKSEGAQAYAPTHTPARSANCSNDMLQANGLMISDPLRIELRDFLPGCSLNILPLFYMQELQHECQHLYRVKKCFINAGIEIKTI